MHLHYLIESVSDQSLCDSSEKKKSRKGKQGFDKKFDTEGTLCGSGNVNKSDGTENIFLESQDRGCCAVSDYVTINEDESVQDESNSSRDKKLKKKKLRQLEHNDKKFTDGISREKEDVGDVSNGSKDKKHKHKKSKQLECNDTKITDDVNGEDENIGDVPNSAKDRHKHKKSKQLECNDTKITDDVNGEDENIGDVPNSAKDRHKHKKSKQLECNDTKGTDEIGKTTENIGHVPNSAIEKHKHKKSKQLEHNDTKVANEINKEMERDVVDVSISSEKKKHKHKKLSQNELNDTDAVGKMHSEMEAVSIVDESGGLEMKVYLNNDKECVSKHHKNKRVKRNRSGSDSFQDEVDGDKLGEWENGNRREKNSNEECVSLGETDDVDIDGMEEMINLLEEPDSNSTNGSENLESHNSSNKSNSKAKLKSPKKTGTKRKLELSFQSDSGKGCHGNKKHKTDKENAKSEDPETKSTKKVVTMSYHDYLQTLVSTVDSCDTPDEMSSRSDNSDPSNSEHTGRKTKLNNKSSPEKQDITEDSVVNENKIENTEPKSCNGSTPSIMIFFTKKSESKSSEQGVSMVIQADVHNDPLSSPVVKRSSQKKEVSSGKKEGSPVTKLLTSSSPGVIRISDDIEILSSETYADETCCKTDSKGKRWSSPRKKAKLKKLHENATNVNSAIVKISGKSKKIKNLKNKSFAKKKEIVAKFCDKTDPDVEITKIDEKVNQQVKNHKKNNSNSSVKKTQKENTDGLMQGEDKEKREAFLKSTGTVTFPAKTAQAKLCFTQSGLSADKSSVAKTNHNTRVRNTPLRSEKKSKKVNKMSTSEKSCLITDIVNSDFVQSLSVKRKKKNSKPMTDGEVVDVEEIKTPSRRPQRTKYKVSGFQFDDSKETPIKIKIRYYKSPGDEESNFTPKCLKSKDKKMEARLAKAQELLHRAKKHKRKRKLSSSGKPKTKKTKKKKKHSRERLEEVASNDESGRRRSRRLAAHANQSLEESVIEIDEEEVTEVRSKTKSKLSTKPGASPRTKKTKPSGKLAPIFMKGGKPDEFANIPKQPEDPEKARLRKAFLMSGIPEELKKQTTSQPAVVYPEFAPLPVVSHVQQREKCLDSGVDFWHLPPVSLCLRWTGSLVHSHCKWSCLGWKSLMSRASKRIFENFLGHDDIPEEVTVKLMEEMKAFNRNYPFADLFKELRTKRQDDINLQSTDDQTNLPCQEAVTEHEVVNVDDIVCKKKKHKKRRKSSSDHEVTVEEKDKPKNKLKLLREAKEGSEKSESTAGSVTECVKHCVKELMWTDRYQPGHSCEVIGHSKNISRMKSWLLEWKHRTDLEERKMRKRMMQQTRGKSTTKEKEPDAWDSDNSDFDIYSENSDDDDDDDDRLCNTLLITGPTGIGKTATVYALAQELGYKVIEVNASSSRNGKRILSQLQEATQSHQVAQSKEGTTNWTNITQTDSVQAFQKSQEKPVPKLPTAFTNLFQKAAAKKTSPIEVIDVDKKSKKHPKKSKKSKKEVADEGTDTSKDAKRKRGHDSQDGRSPKKAKKDNTQQLLPSRIHEDSSQTGSLNLSSTTLILFDEVDIFFDDFDKGFLPAVQHFMFTAKIPIILTTTNSNFSRQLQTRYEQITFKPPSLPDIVSHLQTLCLADNLRSDYHDIVGLVRFYDGDIRRCMLALQLWVDSGGDRNSEERPISTSVKTVKQDTTLSDIALGDSQDTQEESPVHLTGFDEDESEFDTVKRSSKGNRSRIIYDDDANCNPFPVALTASEKSGEDLPKVHRVKVERLLGALTTESELQDSVCRYLQGSDVESLCLTLQNLRSSNIDVLYDNILHLLPLPKTHLEPWVNDPPKTTRPGKKFKRINSDIFDNEESLDSVAESEEETNKEPTLCTMTKDEKVLNLKSLTSFSDFYETMCFIDTLEAVSARSDLDSPAIADSSRGSLCYGMDASVVQHEYSQWCTHSLNHELQSELQLRSARSFCNSIDNGMTEYKKVSGMHDIPDFVHLPVENGSTLLRIHKSCGPRMSGAVRRAKENVTSVLPLSLYCQPRVVSLDYLPTLRIITKVEQLRQVAKAKRRFHHYFDHIGLTLKESTLNVFLSTY
ncbi:ATPase family AAA domain-containing protein 5-like [Gigantopelta aegis]|uniref:ATPase family AAA domain-containing protein 5-like n=1 Tax=Gigantopelta aegis TaxID=1735272 RepID=UPI001B887F64|nr:ATPase family AAA domain-containing protein 5-like [Gigantopelta aegis]